MYRYFMAAGTSFLALGLLFACYLQGALSSAAFYQSATLVLLAVLAFYIMFRSGLNLRFSDPSLTAPQMLIATLVILYAMYAADGERVVFLVLLLMIFLFGVLRLTVRALMAYAAGILCAYGGVISLLWYFKPHSLDLGLELLQWLALAFTLPWFALMGGFISGLRKQLHQSNKDLQDMLQTVQASEANLNLTQSIAGLGGWALDPVLRSVTWTLETYRLFGIDPALPALYGGQYLRLVHQEDRRHYHELIQTALREGRDFDDQFRIVLPTGEIRWMHARGHPLVNADGHTTLLRGTVVDISERKLAEAVLQLSHEKLHELVAYQERIKENERIRIAREIHDELGGVLTGIKANLSVAMTQDDRAGKVPNPRLLDACALLDAAVDTVRRVITDLRPSVLDQLGVWAALEWVAAQIEARSGFRCHVSIDPSAEESVIDAERSTALFRIVQETLTNVARHAYASQVDIRVMHEDGWIRLEVEDNGRGIDAGQLPNRQSWGIAGMAERARYFGGDIRISDTSHGTLVVLRLPLENPKG
ncbi:sensor histidine kinase [Collimonas sp. OK607]|uniref:PAS domain-containing sensor histidine kinase n=1 Tax=Collimonas sp. OK607 TaxID=1798194 RepID=UPI000B862554|nr:sensor histidine kinase [Collimonas sp. OK607]